MAARALPLHNVNGPPHDIAAVATDGDLKRRGCGCRLVHSNSILLSRGPEGFGLSLQDIATFTADALRGAVVMRHEDVAAFAFVALWAIITLGAVMFLAGLR